MLYKYTAEKNTLALLALLKAHGIRKMVLSPGTTNIRLVASVQQDPYFEIYSSADERSAAYIACGMAAESGEPVVLSCTGATASRNYIPALTEAFYRKLPVLAVTSTQLSGRVGQMIPQVLDRTQQLKDMVVKSVQIPVVRTKEDEWACNVHLNDAILALKHRGGGPVHINLETEYNKDFSVETLPEERVIRRITRVQQKPNIHKGLICVFSGAHLAWSEDLTNAVDSFCGKYDAVVLCDQTSNYRGKYRVCFSLHTSQFGYSYASPFKTIDLMIHLGEVSGAYPKFKPKKVWRVHPDGEIKDPFQTLEYVFEMEETEFFKCYSEGGGNKTEQLKNWKRELEKCENSMEELPFSNIWIAKELAPALPQNSAVHYGILNTLRSWNLVETPRSVLGYANTGGFGIDGVLSAAVGASLASPKKIVYCMIGDLAFFYDMNVLGNRHISSNLRILLINNGRGTEFRQYNHSAAMFGEDADPFIAAAGHYGNQSRELVRHYTEDLGFEYLSADSKESFKQNMDAFVASEIGEKPLLLEVFTDSKDESIALETASHCNATGQYKAIKIAKGIIGDEGVRTIKRFLKSK